MVDPLTIGAIAAPVLGGLLGAESARRATDDTNKANREIARDNALFQKEFAQQGIRWRVEDAKKAGIHPLAALGASTQGFSPVAVGHETDMSQANMFSNMGQDISRSIQATRTAEERQLANLQLANAQADLDGKTIDNQIRASQLQKMNQVGPQFPSRNDTNFIPGQGNSGLVQINPSERPASQPGRPAQEAGWKPDVSYSRTDTGLSPLIPKDASESYESDWLGALQWQWRNRVLPNFDIQASRPPENQLPKGFDKWGWHSGAQEWRPMKKGHVIQGRQMFYFPPKR